MTRIHLSPPCMLGRERELLLAAFDSNWIAPLGPQVDAFEREFAATVQVPFAAALSSGTAALHLALQISGVRPGDEVITSSFTFAATANAITYLGAHPVFIDSDWTSWNMDPNLLREELLDCKRRGKLPKVVLSVDVLGQCCDYAAIESICREFDVTLIEDAAEALGASFQGKPAGSFGSMACFSFNGNKIITTSGGGMLVSNNKDWVERARFLATQARDPAPHYEHSVVGYNYRMSNLLAAVGRGQLEVLAEHVRRRRSHCDRYQRFLGSIPGITFMPEPPGFQSTRWLTAILIDPSKFGSNREAIRLRLAELGIESRPAWKPMHLQSVFSDCRNRIRGVCEQIFEQGLCLPSGSNLQASQIEEITQIIIAMRGNA